ncbi:hypothetical protein DKX38_016934 [Salix brachista]|uniref:Retrotransposon Copia-like N-terminal domain-containing protein n=1 Tax=Salix brachista TaxID=2182728 RepID=A0A5N5KUN0_9ROSI|nr:hypothetical protein DKX38_016934 [Salix brachista]
MVNQYQKLFNSFMVSEQSLAHASIDPIYGLMGIVDGSEPSPSKFCSTEHQTQGVLNSDYVVWQYKDQTILGWIISSLSPAVVSTIYGLETSRLAWQALGACFAAPSTSRFRNNNKMRFSAPSKGSSPGFSQFRQPLPHLPSSSTSTAPANTRSRSPFPAAIHGDSLHLLSDSHLKKEKTRSGKEEQQPSCC